MTSGQLARYASGGGGACLGWNRMARRRLRRDLLVLCCHGMTAEPRRDRFGYANTERTAGYGIGLTVAGRRGDPAGDAINRLEMLYRGAGS